MRFILLESVDPDKGNHLRGGTVGGGQVNPNYVDVGYSDCTGANSN